MSRTSTIFPCIKRSFATIFEECSTVQCEKQKGENSGIAVIGLNSPRNKNALSATLVRELNTILDDIYYDPDLRVVILRSFVQGVFCAGIFFLSCVSSYANRHFRG